jgi:hypothetical protein
MGTWVELAVIQYRSDQAFQIFVDRHLADKDPVGRMVELLSQPCNSRGDPLAKALLEQYNRLNDTRPC